MLYNGELLRRGDSRAGGLRWMGQDTDAQRSFVSRATEALGWRGDATRRGMTVSRRRRVSQNLQTFRPSQDLFHLAPES